MKPRGVIVVVLVAVVRAVAVVVQNPDCFLLLCRHGLKNGDFHADW